MPEMRFLKSDHFRRCQTWCSGDLSWMQEHDSSGRYDERVGKCSSEDRQINTRISGTDETIGGVDAHRIPSERSLQVTEADQTPEKYGFRDLHFGSQATVAVS